MTIDHATLYKKFLTLLLCYNHATASNKRFRTHEPLVQHIPLEMVYEVWKKCMILYNFPIRPANIDGTKIYLDKIFPPDINLNSFITNTNKSVLYGFYSATHAKKHGTFQMRLYTSKYEAPGRYVTLTLSSEDWFPYKYHNYKDVVFVGYLKHNTAKNVGYGDTIEYYDYRITTRLERVICNKEDKALKGFTSKIKGRVQRINACIPEEVQNIYVDAINNYKF